MDAPKAILFDFGGTLDDDGRPWLERMRPLWRDAGVSAAEPALDRAFYDADDNLPLRHELSRLGLEETVRLQCADAGAALLPGDEAAARRVADRFVGDCRAAFARNRPVLARLAARFKLGIVSNFYGNLPAVLASEGLDGFFGAVADSRIVGAEKPDAALFLWALERLGARPEDAWMVGDSVKRDMAGAERLGMGHALLSPRAAGPCCPAGRVIRDLAGLEALLRPARVGA